MGAVYWTPGRPIKTAAGAIRLLLTGRPIYFGRFCIVPALGRDLPVAVFAWGARKGKLRAASPTGLPWKPRRPRAKQTSLPLEVAK